MSGEELWERYKRERDESVEALKEALKTIELLNCDMSVMETNICNKQAQYEFEILKLNKDVSRLSESVYKTKCSLQALIDSIG